MTADGTDRFTWVEVASAAELDAWFEVHHAQDEAIWLVTWKKAVPDRYVSTEQVLDALIAYGWCDGIRRRIDDERTRQLVSRRRTQPWAKSYKDRVERLTAEGRMSPAGLAAVQTAKATGMWHAMDEVDALVVPDDLAAALDARPPAAEQFAGFPPSTRRNILRWIENARTPPTRAKRVQLTATEAERGVRVTSNG